MTREQEATELQRQEEFAKKMGGADSAAFHHSRGRPTVQERVALLEDPRPSTKSAPSPIPPRVPVTVSRVPHEDTCVVSRRRLGAEFHEMGVVDLASAT